MLILLSAISNNMLKAQYKTNNLNIKHSRYISTINKINSDIIAMETVKSFKSLQLNKLIKGI